MPKLGKEILSFEKISRSNIWMSEVKRKAKSFCGCSWGSKPYTLFATPGSLFLSPSEWKYNDYSAVPPNTTPINSTGTIINIFSNILEGPGQSERVGQELIVRSVELSARVFADANTYAQDCRVMLVYDRQPKNNGANNILPAITDILSAVTPTALDNLSGRQRFYTVLDRHYNVPPAGSVGVTRGTHSHEYRKVYLPVVYQKGLNYTTTGMFYMIVIGTSAAGHGGLMEWSLRYRYVDN